MLVVLAIGNVDPRLLGVAKRVKEYYPADYGTLLAYLSLFQDVILLPNTITEASNLLSQLRGRRQDCLEQLALLASAGPERYVPSVVAAAQVEFAELGITDAAILCALQDGTCLLTADQALYLAALSRGCSAEHFALLR